MALRTAAISLGGRFTLALRGDGTVVAWGSREYGATDVPRGLSRVKAICAAEGGGYAARSDGSVVAWGFGGREAPPGLSDVTAVAGGDLHALALRRNGTVVCWGDNIAGSTDVPEELAEVTAIAAAALRNLALRADGTVVGWGGGLEEDEVVLSGLTGVTAIAVGWAHSLVLKDDGSVVAWGHGGKGELDPPAGLTDVVEIAAGFSHSLALTRDGRVVGWGDNRHGATDVPAGLANVVAIAAGSGHSGALQNDGTVVLWGLDDNGQASIPAELFAAEQVPESRAGFVALRMEADGGLVIAPQVENPFAPDGRSEELKALVLGLRRAMDHPVKGGTLQTSAQPYPSAWEPRVRAAVQLKRSGRFYESAQAYVNLSKSAGTVHAGVLTALYKTVASGGDLVGAFNLLLDAGSISGGTHHEVVSDHQSRLIASAGSERELEAYLRDLSGNASYWLPRDYAMMSGELNERLTQFKAAFEKWQRLDAADKKERAGGCYIATAVYGSYDAPQVLTLRRFRDVRLAGSCAGRAFIRFYYAVSPGFAERLKSATVLNRVSRAALDLAVRLLDRHGQTDGIR